MSVEPRLAERKGRRAPFADRPRRGADPIARDRDVELKLSTEPREPRPAEDTPEPSSPRLDASPSSQSRPRGREPDLSFLDRAPRERGAMANLMTANDRRGGALAAEDLRLSLNADRARDEAATEAAAPAAPAIEEPLDEPDEAPAEPARQTRREKQRRAKKAAAAEPRVKVEPAVSGVPENALYIGSAIRIVDGRISSCDTLVIDGHMDANLDGARALEVTVAGVFTGSAKVECAQIDGTFDGDLTVTDRLIISETGKVSGKIRYARIEVEPGGIILGDLGTLPGK